MTVRFDEALTRALDFLLAHPDLATRRLLVRDLRGRIRILLADRPRPEKGLTEANQAAVARLAAPLHASLGAWSPGEHAVLLDARVMTDFDRVWNDPDAAHIDEATRKLERTLLGDDWLRAPLPDAPPTVPRAVLYGLKGGVGRSTALAVWARHLAERGRRVLIVDLDLEAPGVGTMLLPDAAHPPLGVVDWLVESAVGQGSEVVGQMYATSPLAHDLGGDVLVAPASGAHTGAYLPKLSRAYQGIDGEEGVVGFGARLARMLDALEHAARPDVVLLDSRSGLHDVAAVSLTRLRASGFLFAVDTSQTWRGYRLLFEHWRQHHATHRAVVEDVRARVFMVAGQVPETKTAAYLEGFRQSAWELFLSTLYDRAEAGDAEAFNFDLDDEGAPHVPIPIYWNRVFQDYDPVRRPDAVLPEQVQSFFGRFLDTATRKLFGEAG